MFYVYVIQSELSGKIYIGQTNDPDLKLKRHNGEFYSKTKSYTKINKEPWKIIHQETFNTRGEVLKRERYLKSHIGRDWLRNIMGR